MNGKRFLLDTNAVAALLRGDSQLIALIHDAEWVGISVISQIEFLAFAGLNQHDRALFADFLQRVTVIGLTAEAGELIGLTVAVRQQHRLKLPDAIIVATAISERASLVSADQHIPAVPQLRVVRF